MQVRMETGRNPPGVRVAPSSWFFVRGPATVAAPGCLSTNRPTDPGGTEQQPTTRGLPTALPRTALPFVPIHVQGAHRAFPDAHGEYGVPESLPIRTFLHSPRRKFPMFRGRTAARPVVPGCLAGSVPPCQIVR